MSWKRKTEEKKRLKHLYLSCNSGYPRPAYFDKDKNCYKRCYKSEDKSYIYHKKYATKRVRRLLNNKLQNIPYRKIYDLWWNTW